LTAGLRYAGGHRLVAPLLLISLFVNFGFTGPVNVGLTLMAWDSEWGAQGLGLLLAGLGGGATVAAVLVGLGRMPGAGTGRLLLAASAVQVVCVGVTPFVGRLPAAVAVQAVLGFAAMVAGNSALSLVQAASAVELRGRVMSLMSLSMIGLTPVVYVLAAVVASVHGVVALFVGGAVVQAVAVAGGLLWAPVRTASVMASPTRAARPAIGAAGRAATPRIR
jgi:hypothetical protein